MARPKKGEEKPKDEAVLQISIEEFIRTRDSVGLISLRVVAPQSLSRRDDKHGAHHLEDLYDLTASYSVHAHIFRFLPNLLRTSTMFRPSEPLTLLQAQQLTAGAQSLSSPLRQITDLTQKLTHNLVVVACDPLQYQLTVLQVVTGLATLQSAVQDLSRAYITHTNTVLGRAPGSRLELMSLANPLGDNGLLGPRAATPAAGTELGDGKKKRKRTPPDPDAPKRPLTPYFLYMKTARPLIAMDVPGNTTPKEIAEEGTRRWAKMGEGERFVSCVQASCTCAEASDRYDQLWGNHYIGNLAKYREQVFEYKAGRGIPDLDNISEEAVKLLIEKHIPLSRRQAGHVLPDIVGDVAEEESDEEIEEVAHEDVLEEVEEEEDEEPSPPPKAPSPPKSPKVHKRRKTTKDAAEAKKPSPIKETPIPVPGSSSKEAAAPVRSIDDEEDDDDEEGKGRKPKTPEKKKRGPKAKGKDSIAAEKAEKSKKEVVEEAKSSPKGESQDSQKKEKKTRKKRKSEATEN